MTETRAVSIEDVRTLVAERQRYDNWLSALAARQAETPARVYERVQSDYAARRGGVTEQLRSHISALAALGDERDAQLHALESALAALEDERVEAMLRTAVGEFDGDRWEVVRQDVESRISSQNAERSALLVEVDDVRTLLRSARSEPVAAGAVTAEQAPAHANSVNAPLEPIARADGVDTAAGATSARPASAETTTADAEALDIEDALALFSPMSPTEPSAVGALAIDTAGIEVIGNEAFGASSPSRAATMTPPASHGAPATQQASAPAAQAAVASRAASAPFDDLAFLRSVIDPTDGAAATRSAGPSNKSTDQLKTLRCTECSTMNLPTEWYCERCGGELAAF